MLAKRARRSRIDALLEFGLADRGGAVFPDDAAAAQVQDAVADRADFRNLVRDEEDANAASGKSQAVGRMSLGGTRKSLKVRRV